MQYPSSEEKAELDKHNMQQAQKNIYVKKIPLFVSYPTTNLVGHYLNEDTISASRRNFTHVPIALLNLSSNKPSYDWNVLVADNASALNLCYESWIGCSIVDIESHLEVTLCGMVRVLSTRKEQPLQDDKILASDHKALADVGEAGLHRCSAYGIKLSNIKESYLLGKSVLTEMQKGDLETANGLNALDYIRSLKGLLLDNLQSVLAAIVLGQLSINANTIAYVPDWFNYRNITLEYSLLWRTKESRLENILQELLHIFTIYELVAMLDKRLGTLGMSFTHPPSQFVKFTPESMDRYFMPAILNATFTHHKSRVRYRIIGFAFDGGLSSNEVKLKVLYYNSDTLSIYVRDASDWVRSFCDERQKYL